VRLTKAVIEKASIDAGLDGVGMLLNWLTVVQER